MLLSLQIILSGKTQEFAEILKSSYLGNGNKSKQKLWDFHCYEGYLNLGIPHIMVNTYVPVKNCNHVAKHIPMSTKYLFEIRKKNLVVNLSNIQVIYVENYRTNCQKKLTQAGGEIFRVSRLSFRARKTKFMLNWDICSFISSLIEIHRYVK